MTARWQSYATPKSLSDAGHRRFQELREREAERQAAAAFRLHLRDDHDEGKHLAAVRDCDFCERAP